MDMATPGQIAQRQRVDQNRAMENTIPTAQLIVHLSAINAILHAHITHLLLNAYNVWLTLDAMTAGSAKRGNTVTR